MNYKGKNEKITSRIYSTKVVVSCANSLPQFSIAVSFDSLGGPSQVDTCEIRLAKVVIH